MSSVANHDLWVFKEPVPARLAWDEEEPGFALVVAGGRHNEVVGCVISLDGKPCARYVSNGLDADKISEILLELAPRITNQVGHQGVLVYHFDGVVSMRIGSRKTVFKFNSLQILYEGYSEVLTHSNNMYRKDVGAVSHGA
jgi:hypothetical protein